MERYTETSRQRKSGGAREAARREAEAEQARQEQEIREAEQRRAEFDRRRKMAQVQWTGDRLEPDDNPESHFAKLPTTRIS